MACNKAVSQAARRALGGVMGDHAYRVELDSYEENEEAPELGVRVCWVDGPSEEAVARACAHLALRTEIAGLEGGAAERVAGEHPLVEVRRQVSLGVRLGVLAAAWEREPDLSEGAADVGEAYWVAVAEWERSRGTALRSEAFSRYMRAQQEMHAYVMGVEHHGWRLVLGCTPLEGCAQLTLPEALEACEGGVRGFELGRTAMVLAGTKPYDQAELWILDALVEGLETARCALVER